MAFQCTVATPEGLLFDGTVTGAIVPAHDGLIGFQSSRAPILLKLGAGVLTLHTGATAAATKDTELFIAGGVAQMKDNVLTILTDEAKPVGQLDVEAARKDVAELSNFPLTSPSEFSVRERKLRRARAVLAATNAH